jgi:hypothetical protein
MDTKVESLSSQNYFVAFNSKTLPIIIIITVVVFVIIIFLRL